MQGRIIKLAARNTKAKDLMVNMVITIEPEQSIVEAVDMMNSRFISRLVVASKEGIVGIITRKDIFRFAATDASGRPLDQVRVNEVMRDQLITVEKEDNVVSIAKVMLENKISSVIVSNGKDRLLGIITKTDILRFYSEKCNGKFRVKDLMSRPVVTVGPANSIFYAAELMMKKKISRLVVIGDSVIRGILTLTDLATINAQLLMAPAGSVGSSESFLGTPPGPVLTVADIMKTNVFSVRGDADLAFAAKIMIEKKISGLPVYTIPNMLEGIVTKTDICRAITKL